MKKTPALIIGAGKIGAFFDTPHDQNILTHAHAYSTHPRFSLVGFVDTDIKAAKKAAMIWGGKSFPSFEAAVTEVPVEVVSICSPEAEHFNTLKEIKKWGIKGGIIEKPLTNDIKTGQLIAWDTYFTDHPFFVNYMRRHVKEFKTLANKIKSGHYGPLVQGTIHHGRGLLHNGSHLLDLLQFFGLSVSVKNVVRCYDDFYHDDISYSAVLDEKQGGQMFLGVLPASLYRVFEMDLLFEKGRVSIRKDGFEIEEYTVKVDKVFKGYQVLGSKKAYETDLGNYMYTVVDDLAKALSGKVVAYASVTEAHKVQQLCHAIATKGKRLKP